MKNLFNILLENKKMAKIINYIYHDKLLKYLVILMILIIINIIFLILFNKEYSLVYLKNKINHNTNELILKQNKYLDKISGLQTLNEIWEWYNIHECELKKNEISLFLYENDSLIFWTGTQVQVPRFYDSKYLKDGFNSMPNGYYWVQKHESEYKKWVSIGLIKGNFPYQNKFVNNKFSSIYGLPDIGNFTLSKDKNSFQFYQTPYYFQVLKFKNITEYQELIQLFLFVLLWIFFLLSIFYLIKRILKENSGIVLVFYFLCVLLLRFVFLFIGIPSIIFENHYFSPVYYASSTFIPSLGDLILHIFTLVILSYLFFSKTKNQLNLNLLGSNLITILLSLIIVFVLIGFKIFLQSLVTDSSINLDLTDIFLINTQSVISYLLIAFVVLSIFFLLTKYYFWVYETINLKTLLFSILIWIIALIIFEELNFVRKSDALFIFFFLCIGILFFRNQKEEKRVKLRWVIFAIVVFAFFTSVSVQTISKEKELEFRKLMIQKISSENDPIAEYLFKNISKEIEIDDVLSSMLSQIHVNEDKVGKYIRNKYFSGYWDKYRIQITFCKNFETLHITPDNLDIDCDKYFQMLKNKIGTSTSVKDLWHLNYKNGYNSFLASFKIKSNSPTSVYIELDSRYNYGELGYPDLLIDERSGINSDLLTYSQAIYSNNSLIKASGKYFYPLTYFSSQIPNGVMKELCINDYSHLLYRIDNQIFILSKRVLTPFSFTSGFSYILAIFVFISFIYRVIINFPNYDFRKSKFRSKIQISILSVLFLTFFVIGINSYYYIKSIYDKKNIENLREKAQSVLTELQNRLSSFDLLHLSQIPSINDILSRLSNVFFTDINIYDENGNLIASSRSQIFKEGLISDIIDPKAYQELVISNGSLLIQNEQIGQQNFMSAYIPIRAENGIKAGFIHLPYFARQSELNREISTFLSTYINVYLILIVISVVLTLFISNRLTKPLLFIQEGISKLRLGKRNEKIEWKSDDELGHLIKEYNRMIDELDLSAQRLAISEREGAWREMAKQVAHEIKNPLTPIKLGIQYLQKAWDDKAPDFDERIKKFTLTLSEQVETLSSIASEFSAFAQMPQPEFSQIDLYETLQTTINLFHATQNIDIKLIPEKYINIDILADKNQFQRLIINILQNAIQAIPNHRKGEIRVILTTSEKYAVIKIRDNGVGIPGNLKEKVFTQNFTTKSTGMGLGLSMVKNSIAQMGGKIHFETEEDVGTEFIIELPVL